MEAEHRPNLFRRQTTTVSPDRGWLISASRTTGHAHRARELAILVMVGMSLAWLITSANNPFGCVVTRAARDTIQLLGPSTAGAPRSGSGRRPIVMSCRHAGGGENTRATDR
jgi:hypothetical protein